jgi:hypothetical protein
MKNALWIGLKSAVLLTLLIIFVTVLVLLFEGKEIKNRRAISGLIVLPFFMLIYGLRFKKIECTVWSVIFHLGLILTIGFLGITIAICTGPDAPHVTETPLFKFLVPAILLFAVSVGGVAHFAGFRNPKKKEKS